MKILHISTGQQGGAAWCAMRISRALTAEGIDSRMLFAEGKIMPEGIEGAIASKDRNPWNSNYITRKIKNQLVKMTLSVPPVDSEKLRYQLSKANSQRLYLHQPLSDYRNIAHHPLVEWADIVHLHWVSDFVDYPTFFKEVRKPIVWTLHDHFPAVGVQHYSSEFYPIPENLKSIDAYCKKIKRESVVQSQRLHIVAISEKMYSVCKASEVLKDFPVTLIHNGVDTSVFRPFDVQESRRGLGLLSDATIFLFSSYGLNDQRKGLDRAIDALEKVQNPNKLLVCIGNIPFNMSIPDASFPIIVTGGLINQTKIAKYYSASDYFLQCSYEEAFAQTPLEAMACGVPVISTPCSGAVDLIRPFNGVVCDGFDSESISVGIKKALSMDYDPVAIRQHILDNYQYDKIARQYIALYRSVLPLPHG